MRLDIFLCASRTVAVNRLRQRPGNAAATRPLTQPVRRANA